MELLHEVPVLPRTGNEEGWYKVGPLAACRTATASRRRSPTRNAANSSTTPAARRCMRDAGYHWTRMIEMLHAAETIKDLLHDPDILGHDLMAAANTAARASA